MKVLNLYAGIGGNRKLWEDVEVTAVEYDPKIAAVYQEFFPDDEVIVTDAHQYLLDHFDEYDFIWASPPCPTHSRMRTLKVAQGCDVVYPDMNLYQEILLLQNWFKGKWVVENVITYYDPLVKPQISNNHYFWCNFIISKLKNTKRGIRGQEKEFLINKGFFDLSNHNISESLKMQVLRNCVEPELALHIFNMAFKERQVTI